MSIPSESYHAARDWLYVAAALSGTALAVPTYGLFHRGSHGKRIRGLWSVFFVLLAAIIASVAHAFVLLGGFPSADLALLRISSAIVLVSAVSLRFPRAVGFPVLVSSGVIVSIFMGFLLYFLPCTADHPIGLLRVGADGRTDIRFEGASTLFAPVPFSAAGDPLRMEAFEVEFDRAFPFVGGSRRSALYSVQSAASAPLFGGRIPAPLLSFLRSSRIPGIRIYSVGAEIETLSMYPGTRAFISVSGNEIVARIVR